MGGETGYRSRLLEQSVPADNSQPTAADEAVGVSQPPPPPEATPPLIPWEHRKEIGVFKAYWQTVFYVSALKGRLADNMDRPISLASAKRFRFSTVILNVAALAVIFLVSLTTLGIREKILNVQIHVDILALLIGVPIGIIFSGICLSVVTRAAAWFFCSKKFADDRQDRAIALSYYTCAPLAFMPILPLLAGISLAFVPLGSLKIVLLALSVWALLDWLAWYRLVLTAVHTIMGRSVKRTVFTALALPIVWVGIPAMFLLILPAIAMWMLMIASLS